MTEYIKREAAIAYIREQSEEWQKAFEELGEESGIYADAYNDLAENFYGIPAAKVVSLHDIYRVIAGHSYYHGDRILAALTCIAEGKKVNPVRPSDVAPVVRCEGCEHAERYERADGTAGYYCGHPQNTFTYGEHWDRVFKPAKEADDYCSYGKRKDGGAE